MELKNKCLVSVKEIQNETEVAHMSQIIKKLCVHIYITRFIVNTCFIYLLLKGHGPDFGQLLFFCLYYLQCYRNVFLIIKINLDDSR